MKVKFLENYGKYNRGMQYPIEQVGKEKAEQLEKEGIARMFPLIDFKINTQIEVKNTIEPKKTTKTAKNPKKKG